MHHVFCNLVNNAIDVMPDGGTITLRFSVRDGEAVTEIEDTGPGFAPEIVARLFQPFATHGKGAWHWSWAFHLQTHRRGPSGHIHAHSERGAARVFHYAAVAGGVIFFRRVP